MLLAESTTQQMTGVVRSDPRDTLSQLGLDIRKGSTLGGVLPRSVVAVAGRRRVARAKAAATTAAARRGRTIVSRAATATAVIVRSAKGRCGGFRKGRYIAICGERLDCGIFVVPASKRKRRVVLVVAVVVSVQDFADTSTFNLIGIHAHGRLLRGQS